ncbi:uncharacterized protein [Gossypium hirsutum]|uniref:RNase H type-1 domain-containing protein n=1 Tax=Gossypium hirsutum TaxID=3635 RepID=A0A1U8MWX2_GOSHI|nr:uncharacterized protein LOC107941086 [Gossypium hirsutum]
MESTALNRRMARWQILLSEFDMVYASQKAIKGSAIADFLASRALEDYEPLDFDFPDEDLMYIANSEEDSQENHSWRMNFDGASNALGNGIGAILVSPNGDHHPFPNKLEFDYTNNMAKYEACIMDKGEWETRNPKLIRYRRLVLELIEEFDNITFWYLPREENQMADALATLASMIKVNKLEDMKPIQISIYEIPAYCYSIEEVENDNCPWYQDILQYVKDRKYPNQNKLRGEDTHHGSLLKLYGRSRSVSKDRRLEAERRRCCHRRPMAGAVADGRTGGRTTGEGRVF